MPVANVSGFGNTQGIQSQDLVKDTGRNIAGVLNSGANANLADSLRTSAMDSWKAERIAKHTSDRDIAQDARDQASEKRANTREDGVLNAKNTREDKLLAEKRAYDKPLQDAKIRQADASTAKDNRWESSGAKERLDKVQKLSPSEIREEKAERKQILDSQIEDIEKSASIWWDPAEKKEKRQEAIDTLKTQYKSDLLYLDSFKSEQSRRAYLANEVAPVASTQPTGKVNYRKKVQ